MIRPILASEENQIKIYYFIIKINQWVYLFNHYKVNSDNYNFIKDFLLME